MNLADIALLSGAGLAAGTVNAIAGGGSLITFPALIATGLSPVAANVTNSVSVFPGYTASVYGSRMDLGDLPRRTVLAIVPTAVVAAALGCALLLITPARAFDLVVPFLVLAATTTLAFQDRLRRLVGNPRDMSPARRTLSLHAMVFAGSLYGGYFGAALGVMLVAALGLVLDQSMAKISALKNVVSAIGGLVTVCVFALFGPVEWLDVLVVAPTAMLGGYAGARLARRLPSAVLKWLIVAFGTSVGLILLYRAMT
ncbi:sulfite exporter TauE/SafE family protein [Dactylosporangium sp. NPDC000521]|uniref:sulfite exporter TauE/SafE family protein n=1 Tax=Dactylosporangium sp. NPDC000521 TaxID=3363975 RepID=UPI0036A7D0B0